MTKLTLDVKDDYLNFILNLLSNLKDNMIENINIDTDYELWSKEELEHISKVDLSTPLKDDEDYSKW
jgi:hypothetical protein